MAIDTLLILSRFVHVFAASLLFGAACFPFYGFSRETTDSDELPSWLRPLLISAAACTLASSVVWFLVLAADSAGTLLRVTDDAIVAPVLATNFGWVWPSRFLVGTGLLLLLMSKGAGTGRSKTVLVGSAILLASIALNGNAGSNEGPTGFQHRLMDAVHLLASGIWVGALVIFAILAIHSGRRQRRDDDVRRFRDSLSKFSEVGTVTVVILTFSGMLNPAFFLSSLRTAYGQLLLVKIAIFATMLGLAALNRFWLTPRLAAALDSVGQAKALRALRASIVAESALAVLVLALVAWLSTLSPPTS